MASVLRGLVQHARDREATGTERIEPLLTSRYGDPLRAPRNQPDDLDAGSAPSLAADDPVLAQWQAPAPTAMQRPPHARARGANETPTASAQQHRAEPGAAVSRESTPALPDASATPLTARADPTQTPMPRPVAISRETQPELLLPDPGAARTARTAHTASAARERHPAPGKSTPAAPLSLRPTLNADAVRPSPDNARAVRTVSTARTNQPEPSPPAQSARESARDVDISIGRIELRADAAQSAQPRQRAAFHPRVSLGDFLGRRDGGKR